jgi:ribonuclease HII
VARRRPLTGILPLFPELAAEQDEGSPEGPFELGRPETLTGFRQFFPTPPSRILRSFRSGKCSPWFEKKALEYGFVLPAGTDEAGRGALFGPVVAAAVILDVNRPIKGINDSKQLTASRREELELEIKASAIGWAIAEVSAAEIDQINIYQASRLALRQSVLDLSPQPDFVFVDAMRLDLITPQLSLIHGDAICQSIAAASILAKVERDRQMQDFGSRFPGYNLGGNKGYGTPDHFAALNRIGATEHHRKSYAPVAKVLPVVGSSSDMLF